MRAHLLIHGVISLKPQLTLTAEEGAYKKTHTLAALHSALEYF